MEDIQDTMNCMSVATEGDKPWSKGISWSDVSDESKGMHIRVPPQSEVY
jgi:hypothetical protein